MQILILGHTGFVGQNIVKLFSENNISIVGASRSTGIDIRDKNQTTELIKAIKPDWIINCAAHVGSLNYVTKKAAEVVSDNTLMILSIYEAVARECPTAKILNPIANCAYPAHLTIFNEDDLWSGKLHRTVLSFGATRRLLLNVAESYEMQHNIHTINLLVPNMYGPFDSTDPNKAHALNALVSKFIKAEKEKQSGLNIWGTGIAIREWLYAKDFARILLQIIQTPKMIGLSEPINIAQNFGLSVKELVAVIQTHFNYKGNVTWDHAMPDGAPKKVMDDTKFKKVFTGFKFTDFNEGILNTISYYNSIYPY